MNDLILESRDFSVAEDHPEFMSILRKLTSQAARNAAAEAKAAGLPHTFVRGEHIVCSYPDGREEIISSAEDEQIKGGSYYIVQTHSFINARAK